MIRTAGLLLVWTMLVVGGCGRGPTVGEAEIADELRAMRLAMRTQATAPVDARRDVQQALDPLRDVLQKMVQSQQQLNERQGALAGEMRRWTQLVATSAERERARTADELAQRLEQLEQQIAAQEQRHQETEALLGDALAHTADQLEEFLRRVGVEVPTTPAESTMPTPAPANAAGGTQPDAGEPKTGEPKPGEAKTEQSKTGGSQPSVPPAGSGGSEEQGQQASLRWLWWSLAATSMITGLLLMHRRKDDEPVGIAQEMQVASDYFASMREDELEADEVQQHEDPQGAVGARVSTADDPAPAPDEPEVEELWTAAALLGEAIGKLKQTGAEAIASLPPVELPRPPAATAAQPEPPAFAPHEGEGGAANSSETAAATPGPCDDPHAQTPATGHQPEELYIVDGLEDEPAPDVPAPRLPPPPATAPQPTAAPHVSVPEPPQSVTFRLPVQDDPAAERCVRELLESDPRVLLVPRPDVRKGAHELTVRFALLPGLPAAERSVVEQRLRDAIA